MSDVCSFFRGLVFYKRPAQFPHRLVSVRFRCPPPPFRELGVQIHSMCRSLSQFTDISCALVVGGNKNLKAQVCVFVKALLRQGVGGFGPRSRGAVARVSLAVVDYCTFLLLLRRAVARAHQDTVGGLMPRVARCAENECSTSWVTTTAAVLMLTVVVRFYLGCGGANECVDGDAKKGCS